MAGAQGTVDLDVTGMTCAACQANVQRALSRQPGVTDATVNLMTGQARITFDPSLVSPPQLVDAVEAIGYGSSVAAREASAITAQTAQDAAEQQEFVSLRRRAVVSGVIGVVAMLLSMPLMLSPVHGQHPSAGAV